jgi:hypothetical protein
LALHCETQIAGTLTSSWEPVRNINNEEKPMNTNAHNETENSKSTIRSILLVLAGLAMMVTLGADAW